MPNTKFFVTLILVSALFISCSSKKEERTPPRELTEGELKIDKIISEATFQDLEGNDINIADLKGKVVLIDFWETWCGPCLQVFPIMDSLQNEYPEDFVIIAVNLNNSDTVEDVRTFKDKNDYIFQYAIDNNKIGDQVITLGIPFKIYMDPDGYLIKAELGISSNDYETTKEIIEQYKTS